MSPTIRRLLGLVLFFAGAILLFNAGRDALQRDEWRRATGEAEALVLAPEAGVKLAREIPALADAKAVVRIGRLRPFYAELDSGLATMPPPGSDIAVLVDPQQPQKVFLNNPLSIWADQIKSGGLALILALVGYLMMKAGSGQGAGQRARPPSAIAAAIQQAASRQANSSTRPAFGGVVQRQRDGAVSVHRTSGPAVVRTIERPSGAGPILVFIAVIIGVAAYFVLA